ncbi:PREDICTED: peroxisomal membrane protein 4 isoform X2 [Miniopterus natalensis]|uniref:peroxisomal membrane protein 4 isoform X2 n=1 Tax=Miniopterus natalensis TaxID=291302 RepID=UPI0007A6C721|nr:PREDICTED: peroxisomal membrane protein 4 isoform X2 [Miniopterus natalensis]
MAAPPQLRGLLLAVNALLRKRRYHAALAVLKGFRNGAVYGAKIRAPHALVMTFLFRSGRSTCTCCHASCLPSAAWEWRRATFLNPGGTHTHCSPGQYGGWCCGSLSTTGTRCSPHCSLP